MAPNWTPEQQVANDAEVEVIVFEIIESVVRWAQERRERETLEAVTKNIMEMVIDISNDVSHCGVMFVGSDAQTNL
jgi:predicted HTH transcriptional regulator